ICYNFGYFIYYCNCSVIWDALDTRKCSAKHCQYVPRSRFITVCYFTFTKPISASGRDIYGNNCVDYYINPDFASGCNQHWRGSDPLWNYYDYKSCHWVNYTAGWCSTICWCPGWKCQV